MKLLSEKKENLKDGTEITIRSMTLKDLDPLMKFFKSLPQRDRRYFRVDVTDGDVMTHRIKLMKSGNFIRIVALQNNRIIATGILELSAEEWRKHQGELRTIVDPDMRHKGLGTVMLRELYHLAADPDENNNLSDSSDPEVKKKRQWLNKKLLERMKLIEDPVLALADAG